MARPETRALSEVLGDLPEDRAVPLGEAMGPIGARAHGVALLLLGLPDAVPLPIPSVSLLVGLPLLAVSAHLMLFGEGAGLPRRLSDVTMPAGLAGALRRRVAPLLRRAERLSRPRWTPVAARGRLLGLVCLWLSAILLLPLPFFNTPPALCLVLVAWGMLQRDGLVVLAGLAGTLGVTAALGWAADQATVLLVAFAHGLAP